MRAEKLWCNGRLLPENHYSGKFSAKLYYYYVRRARREKNTERGVSLITADPSVDNFSVFSARKLNPIRDFGGKK